MGRDISFGLLISLFLLSGILFGITRPLAKEVRLIGLCQEVYYAAMEEDNFPENCDWIKPI